MEEILAKKIGQVQDDNINLMTKHLRYCGRNLEVNEPVSEDIRANHVILTKMLQMQKQMKTIPKLDF